MPTAMKSASGLEFWCGSARA